MISEAFKENVYNSFYRYFGKNVNEIAEHFELDSNSKNFLEMISSRILGCQGKVNQSLDFIRSNVTVKTVKIQENGKIKESMSFPNFDFKKIIKTNWKESELRNLFLTQTFLFVVFVIKNGSVYLSHIKFWNMPLETLESEVKNVWKRTVDLIKSGNIVAHIKYQKDGKPVLKTNFPGIGFNGVCHVRPHAQNANDTYDLPIPDKMTGMVKFTKQCFWLNSGYIREIVQ